jgi:hypothetical protein
MARSAPVAVALYRRRGKETWVVKITYAGKGDTHKQKIEVGARFNGRFYPTRCDLSPDGKHFAYFVMGGYQKGAEKKLYCWTAMSRPPALTAEFLLPQHDTWGGAAHFVDSSNLLVAAGMYCEAKDISALNGRDVNGVKVWVADFGQQPPVEFDRIEPVPDGWKGTPTKQWLAGCWYREQVKCTLMMRYRDDRRESGEYSAFEYRLAGTYAEPVLPDEYMDTVQWADFDRLGRLWVARGSNIEIFTKPRPGMTVHPNRTIDLEAEVAKVRKHA